MNPVALPLLAADAVSSAHSYRIPQEAFFVNGSDLKAVVSVRIALGLFLVGLLYLSYRVLHLFLPPVAWAVILVYVTWPAYRTLRSRLGSHVNVSALVMTLLLAGVFVLPLLWVIAMLRNEVPTAYLALIDMIGQGKNALPQSLLRLPWIGREIERFLELASTDPAALRSLLLQWWKPWADETISVLGDIGRTAFRFAFALLTAFFLYRDGEPLLEQARSLLLRLLGDRAEGYLRAIGGTMRAVLYGLILTALIQGVLAGLGYWVAGVRAPVLLGVVTVVLALVPFGAPLVWGAVSIWLLTTGNLWAGVGLAVWGAVVVSQIDNLLRPLLISSATRIPYLLVLFGVLGGISAFGLIGLFLGPIVIAVLLAVWREWVEERAA
jgi:predicted PurR-regulated permease PerM